MTIHLLKWRKTETFTTPCAGEDTKQKEPSFIAGGNAKCHNYFGRLAVSYKMKYILTIRSRNHAPWYSFKWFGNMSTQKPAQGCL